MEDLRSKLNQNYLTPSSNATIYINNLLNFYIKLNKITGKYIFNSCALLLFISVIIGPDFQLIVQIQRNKGGSLVNYLIAVINM